MNRAISFVKYLFLIFNSIFTLLGLSIVGVGIWVYFTYGALSAVENLLHWTMIFLIVLGVITFVIAFTGCCGAIQENRCMIITFAVFLLIALIAQIVLIVLCFSMDDNTEMQTFIGRSKLAYKNIFDKYEGQNNSRKIIDFFQSTFSCCGFNSFNDFETLIKIDHIPLSCCGNAKDNYCMESNVYTNGCVSVLTSTVKMLTEILNGILIGVAVIELIGITLASVLANSLNQEQKGYRF